MICDKTQTRKGSRREIYNISSLHKAIFVIFSMFLMYFLNPKESHGRGIATCDKQSQVDLMGE